jgi:hypothetical protein
LAAATAASGGVVPLSAQQGEPDRHRREGESEPEGTLGGAQDRERSGRDIRPSPSITTIKTGAADEALMAGQASSCAAG